MNRNCVALTISHIALINALMDMGKVFGRCYVIAAFVLVL